MLESSLQKQKIKLKWNETKNLYEITAVYGILFTYSPAEFSEYDS